MYITRNIIEHYAYSARQILAVFLLFVFLSAGLSACAEKKDASRETISPQGVLENEDQVIADLRTGLREHSREITVRFSHEKEISLSALSDLCEEWVEKALQETDDPREGDYIRYQYGGYEISCHSDRQEDLYTYTLSIVPEYYMYLSQEEEVTERVQEIMRDLSFESYATDAEKIYAIYDYVCQNISYDRVHKGNPHHSLRSTSYAGLIWGSATCQGYCVTLYRLLREAGFDCRIVTGTGRGEEFHAWNIVELNGSYYCLDATWDANQETYAWFLKGSTSFPDHAPGEVFTTPAFLTRYPISEADYTSDDP